MSPGTLAKTNYHMFFSISSTTNVPDDWSLRSCLEHVVNLANVAVMTHITKLAAVENQTAIWEYDPDEPGNRVLGGSLDVIAAIRTIAIKVCSASVIVVYGSIFVLDSGLRSTYRIFRELTNSVQHRRPTQNPPPQQR
jgi:hypothetical protein